MSAFARRFDVRRARLLVAGLALIASRTQADDVEFFERHIRPLLAENCWKCHGAEQQKGGLRLDSRAAALQGGDTGPALVAGDPEASLMVDAVRYGEVYQMPPTGKLPDERINELVDWVRRGAPWPGSQESATGNPSGEPAAAGRAAWDWNGWAFRPRRVVDPPEVRDRRWPRDALDRFVLARLEAEGLSPAPALAPLAWLRRATFDVTGLPPTIDEIISFTADETSEARERVVDRLLASPAYGERWARHWLDVMRFAETAGHEFDFELPEAYRYRDYVIRALDDDVPFDQFVREHLAGDLAPPRYDAQGVNQALVATGWYFLGEAKHSPVDVLVDRLERTDNQIDVLGKAFLGLTISCARCHDHKFDPIPQTDYYALVGVLHSSRYRLAAIDDPAPRVAALAQLATLADSLQSASADATSGPAPTPPAESAGSWVETFSAAAFDAWSVEGEAFGAGPTRAATIVWEEPDDQGRRAATRLPAGVASSGALALPLAGALRSATFEIDSDVIYYRVAGHGGRVQLVVEGLQHIREPIYGDLRFHVEGRRLAWHAQDVRMWRGRRAYIELFDDGPGWLAVDEIRRGGPAPDDQSAAEPSVPTRPAPQVAALLVQRDAIAAGLAPRPRAMAIGEGTPRDEPLLIRGNPKTPSAPTPRRSLAVLGGQPVGADSSGRGELARLWTDPAQPLVPRVIVNRVWQHHFGEGLVRSPDNFGRMGQPPTHPELLDWLTQRFVDEGWSLKRLHRRLMLSATYGQSGRVSAEARERDPKNLLWHHVPPRRLEAEALRDAMLAVAGRLDPTRLGPSVPPHLTEFMQGRGRPAASGPLDGAGRRSIYLNVRRNFLTPMLVAFDYPTPFSAVGARSRANVPGQALVLWNNPLVRELARSWAERTLAMEHDDAARLWRMYLAAFGREPDDAERMAAGEFLRESLVAGDERVAWGDLAHVLLNSKEFAYVP